MLLMRFILIMGADTTGSVWLPHHFPACVGLMPWRAAHLLLICTTGLCAIKFHAVFHKLCHTLSSGVLG